MNENKKYIWLVVALIVVWYYSQKVQAANALTVRYLLPKGIHIDKGAVIWTQPIVITNPTGTPISLSRYNMQVFVEGYPVGTAYGTIATMLSAGRDTTLEATVLVPIMDLISLIPSLKSVGRALDFRFQGRIVAEFLNVPVDTMIAVPLPKLPF